MKVEWFFPLDYIPRTTAQQKGYNRRTGRYFTKDKVKEVADLYDFMLTTHRPPQPLTGAVRVKVQFFYPAKKPHKHGEPKATRPDADNMVKLLFDRATACGYWSDDGQIADLRIIKAYADIGGIGFQAVEIGQGEIER